MSPLTSGDGDMQWADIADRHFRRLFAIADGHALNRINFEAKPYDTFEWRHEERDQSGRVIALYTTCIWFGTATGASYSKTDPDGQEIDHRTVPELLELCGRD
jgi:hypothetical protein